MVHRSIFGNVVGLNLMSGDCRPEALHGGEPYCIYILYSIQPQCVKLAGSDRCKRPLRSNEIAYQMVALGAPGM